MVKENRWLSSFLILINAAFVYFYLTHLLAEPTPRFSIIGLIPVFLGLFAFFYIHKSSAQKTLFTSITQTLNILFIISPILTVVFLLMFHEA
ncbi:hypothetical protein [Pradoshia sp.]|uniref:hypothetical protein n=1 Tax=Pradoshia sp. TaxID=2651281 RepID=UPI003F0048B7